MYKIIKILIISITILTFNHCKFNNKDNEINWLSYIQVQTTIDKFEKSIIEFEMYIEESCKKNRNKEKELKILDHTKKFKQIMTSHLQLLDSISTIIYVNDTNKSSLTDKYKIGDSNLKIIENILQDIRIIEKTRKLSIVKQAYEDILKEEMQKIYVLMALQNLRYELAAFTKNELEYFSKKMESGGWNPKSKIKFAITAESKEVAPGDTFKAIVYPYNFINPHFKLTMNVNGKNIPVDSNGLGHYVFKAKAKKFNKNGLAYQTYYASVRFKYQGKDTVFKANSGYWVKKPCE